MNKNKLIFLIIWAGLLIILLFIVFNLKKDSSTWVKTTWNFNIWILWDNVDNARLVVEKFKSIHPEYSSKIINVESFSSYDDYLYALTSAITADKTPDIFVLNNNEKNSVFSNQVIWIDPQIINPNDFRKKFKWVFADDLIITIWEWEQKQEFLVWIPVWYETLWVFYNRRYIKASEISSLSWLNNVVTELKDKYKNLIPIWIWNGSTVLNASDIITQFFMLENGVSWLSDVVWTKLKQWLASYLLYWDTSWYNGFDSRFMELSSVWQNSIDLFSKWETFMVVGYPRLIKEIAEKWFSKNFLLASVFPHYYSWDWNTLVNYNYFVINKDTTEYVLANDFLSYLATDMWADDYLNNFPYYLPALLSLESDKLEEKISEDYNVVLKDFYNPDYELSSFDKWIKSLYDKDIISILDNSSNYESAFNKFRTTILCKAWKIATLENLSNNCDQ
jgi:hypothetical protein